MTVLLTGASGVVGRPLLTRLVGSDVADIDVVCLVHRTPLNEPGATSARGDITDRRLGLPDEDYERLAERIDAIVHCAAVTEFNRTDGSLERTNIEGTEHMVALAERAGVPIYHVSTAFLHARADGERGRTAVGYAASKRAGEDVVRRARTPHVILRPSVVIGDSTSGDVAAFQGFYRVAGAILSGAVPMIPFDPSWPIDVVPCDVVADAIATVVERGVTSGEFWLTSGGHALTLADAVSETLAYGAEQGIAVHRPKFVPPELFDRLIGPVFLEALPPKVRLTAVRLLEFFSAYLSMDTAMPSDLETLAAMGAKPLPDQRTSLRASLGYWAEQTGVAATADAKVA